ncbi:MULTISPECIES: GNAT family N-acetyltransferase [Lentisalinibacter]|uniref:GNAT family N-acetyltransferase n=1 Tax=Lentisalinibacter TaxID=3382081 RepID=UPI00386BD27B
MTDRKPEVRVRQLRTDDNRTGFDSGNIELDRFFRRYAGQNQFRHHVGSTYVAVHGNAIAGFMTVSMAELTSEKLTKKLRRRLPGYPMPVLRLARLAVDRRWQGHGVGRLLLRSVLELALEMRDRVGCTGVVVDAKADAVGFYASLGFGELDLASGGVGDRPPPEVMFLPIARVAAGRG